MENHLEALAYETPMVELITVEVEKGFAVSDPTGEGEDMPWG